MNRRLLILDVVTDVVVRTAIVFAVYLLLSGHNAPGGGFIAGLVVGSCLVVRYIARGGDDLDALVRVAPDRWLGTGLLVAVLVGVAGWIWGTAYFASGFVEFDVPVFGLVKAPSALLFDVGVFAVVVGLTIALVGALGDESEGGET